MCPKTPSADHSKLVASTMREDFLWKDKLVMPLDIAMQNAQLKNAN
jgi:NADH-quinone oxidoreductase subunit I